MPENKRNNYLSYLIKAATLNDSLLQAYRHQHLTLQSIFLAIGSGLLVAVFGFKSDLQSRLVFLVLFVLAVISIYITKKMQKIVIARGEDVSFWHRELIKAERDLASEKRYFTQFKIHQGRCRPNANHLKDMFLSDKKRVTDKDIYQLVGEGLDHTRKVLDKWLFSVIRMIWLGLIVVSVLYLVYKWLSVLC